MEVQEEGIGCREYTAILKGKRTKRPRQASPLPLTMAYSSSTTAGGGASDNSDGAGIAAASPEYSAEFTDGMEEEEDMANCLILLAQGHDRSPPEPVAPAEEKARLYLYQCKTCDRCFPSFQALGGHRASHKKPKPAGEEKPPKPISEDKKPRILMQDQLDHESTVLSLQIPNRALPGSNNKSRVHECSICRAEFSSGQALGGHMRRHRPVAAASSGSPDRSQEVKRSRNVLALDLNLPAPEDDHHHRESKFPFGSSKEQVIVFSASSLVDCHY